MAEETSDVKLARLEEKLVAEINESCIRYENLDKKSEARTQTIMNFINDKVGSLQDDMSHVKKDLEVASQRSVKTEADVSYLREQETIRKKRVSKFSLETLSRGLVGLGLIVFGSAATYYFKE